MSLSKGYSAHRTSSFANTLVKTVAAVAATASVGKFATDPKSAWYRQLNKPVWQPPAAAFPIVWSSLYAGLAVTSAAVLHRLHQREACDPSSTESSAYRKALAVNLVLNGAWSVIFWRGRHLTAATAESAALAVSTADLVRRSASAQPTLGFTLLPYVAWAGYATVLAGALASKNR